MSTDPAAGTITIDSNRPARGYIYAFREFEFHVQTVELFCSGQPAGLQPKPARLLLYLIEHRQRTVPKEELLEAIWPSTYVTDSSFTTAIGQIRQALNDDGDRPGLIRTFRSRGYRFVGAVTSCRVEATPEDTQQAAEQARLTEPNHWLLQHRPGVAVAGALATTLLIVAVLFYHQGSETALQAEQRLTFEERDWVLITSFENRTGEALFDDTLEYALTHTLANSRFVNVVPRQRVQDALQLMKQPANARVNTELGLEISQRDGGIRALLTGRVEKFGTTYVLSVQIVNPVQGLVVSSLIEEARGEDQVWPAIVRLASGVRETLGEDLSLIQLSENKLVKVTTPSLRALQLYSEADEKIIQGESKVAEPLLRQAIAVDPEFASAYTLLAYALDNQIYQHPAQDPPLPYARKAFQLAEQISVPDRERYFIRASYFYFAGEYEDSLENYEVLRQLHPDHYWAANNRAILQYQLGRYTEAAMSTAKIAELRPTSFISNWRAYTQLNSLGGHLEAASRYLERARKLADGAEHPLRVASMRLRASTLRWLEGDLVAMQAEIEKWTQVFTASSGRYRSALAICLGFAHSILGQRHKADDYFEAAAEYWPMVYQRQLLDQAWKAGETKRISELTSNFFENDLGSRVRALASYGFVEEARKYITESEATPGSFPAWVRGILVARKGQVAYSEGRHDDAISLLTSFIQQDCEGITYYFREVLANAWLSQGNIGEAIRVLEQAAGDKLTPQPLSSECHFTSTQRRIRAQIERDSSTRRVLRYDLIVTDWMRIKLRLAQLYRQTDRGTEAQQIEEEIRALLVYADADYWMVRYLEGRVGFEHLAIDGPYDRVGLTVSGKKKLPLRSKLKEQTI